MSVLLPATKAPEGPECLSEGTDEDRNVVDAEPMLLETAAAARAEHADAVRVVEP